jgi:leucine dehydrogenase
MRACVASRFGEPSLRGHTVTMIGLAHVGSHLAGLLTDDGARLAITDLDPEKRGAAEALGAEWIEPAVALGHRCDVLAPCALGGVIDEISVERLECEVLCGAANNVLTSEPIADRLAERGILYAPDFIANAGGLISVYGELHGYPHSEALELAAGIESTVGAILADAERAGSTPLQAARRRSAARLDAAAQRRVPAHHG